MEDNLNIQPKAFDEFIANIKVIGVGGGGCNAVNRMIAEEIEGVDFWVANTDAQVLLISKCQNRITLGYSLTEGLGAGADPEIGKKAAKDSEEDIKQALRGANMVFVAAGMGGGTGTGAAPVIAKIAKDLGALTIGIVTRPFGFEGRLRNSNAVQGIQELQENVDAIVVVSNDKLAENYGSLPINESFKEADNVLAHSVKTITDLILKPSLVNRDFADIRTVMKGQGLALIGMGMGSGDGMAYQAAQNAINCPLLETSIKGAKNAIVNVAGGSSLTINDANDVIENIKTEAGSDINILWGTTYDESLGDKMVVTVIATGFGSDLEIGNVPSSQQMSEEIPISPINIDNPKIEPQVGLSVNSEIKKEEVKPEFVKEPQEEESSQSLLPAFLRKRKK